MTACTMSGYNPTQSSHPPCKVGIFVSGLQMSKLRLREHFRAPDSDSQKSPKQEGSVSIRVTTMCAQSPGQSSADGEMKKGVNE